MKFNIVALTFVGKSEGFEFAGDTDLIGGAEVYLYDLCKFLIKEGHDVTVIQPWYKHENFEFDGITVNGIKLHKLFKSQFEFSFIWKKYVDKNTDFKHVHNFDYAFPFADNKMTGTCHGINWDCPQIGAEYDKTIYERYIPNLKWSYLKYRARYAILHLKKIASVDTFLLRYVQSELPEFRDKIKVIPNYVNTDIFNPDIDGSEIKRKYGVNKFIILFPRNISYVRGIHFALDSIKMLSHDYPDILLLITGDGPQKDWAIKYIQKNNLQENVALVGHKDHFKDMPYFYAAADLVIIPTFCSEGTSLSCLEAMATKKPVVVTNIGGLIDIIIDEYNGLICDPSADSLKDKIKLLIENQRLRKELSTNALYWIKERYNYNKWTKAYKDFFEI